MAIVPHFFFNDTATTEIYTLSLHDALPIYRRRAVHRAARDGARPVVLRAPPLTPPPSRRLCKKHPAESRSEEHTSELQSRQYLVCRLLLEKKKNKIRPSNAHNTQQTSLSTT